MKKIFYILIALLLFPLSVFAKNNIYSIDMEIYLYQDGSADIKEKWNVKGSDGTEWYKVINGVTDETLTNYKVYMDEKALTYKTWNVDESLEDKKGFYGINYTSSGMELCFGKYDFKNHIFSVNYTLKNFVVTSEDSQVIYWNLIDKLSNVNFEKFSVTITGFYNFPDTLDVWGYGYKGYAYVENGKIKMSSEEKTNMNDSYVVLLAKFPSNTFTTTYSVSGYDTFEDIHNMAENGSYKYDYSTPWYETALEIFFTILPFLIFGIIAFIIVRAAVVNGYGYKNNKTIEYKKVNMFRDIPCNKDIFYANVLTKLNPLNFTFRETNILGATILKWVKEDKIVFKNETKGIFNKNTSTIDLTLNPTFDTEFERKLFDLMYVASKDGILEARELEYYCRRHYNKFFSIFSDVIEDEIIALERSNDIYDRSYKKECKFKHIMSDRLYDDSVQLLGLKKYLVEFSRIKTKEVMEVKIWDEYLMFAYLFGIADKVAKQLKNLYPEVLEMNDNFNYDTFVFIDHISTSSFNAASSARNAAQSYSSGGGGFSSGGGGGGSFGGGGGGSR